MVELNLEKRIKVLETSLLVEHLTSKLLASILEIKDFDQSKTLGNKGSALSFSQKINLLIDVGALENEKRAKFQRFMEIRNQFMHNADANCYTNCLSFIDGAQNYLLKCYPAADELELEKKLEIAVSSLCGEVLNETIMVLHFVTDKYAKQARDEAHESLLTAMTESIATLVARLDVNPNLVDTKKGELGSQMFEIFKELFDAHPMKNTLVE